MSKIAILSKRYTHPGMRRFLINLNWGLIINGLYSGKGFSLRLGDFLRWDQAWFGRVNEVTHWNGKFILSCFYLNVKYSPKLKWEKVNTAKWSILDCFKK